MYVIIDERAVAFGIEWDKDTGAMEWETLWGAGCTLFLFHDKVKKLFYIVNYIYKLHDFAYFLIRGRKVSGDPEKDLLSYLAPEYCPSSYDHNPSGFNWLYEIEKNAALIALTLKNDYVNVSRTLIPTCVVAKTVWSHLA